MGRHNGSKRRWKPKSYRRDNQQMDSKGGYFEICGRKYYNHQMDSATNAFKQIVEEALMNMQAENIITGFARIKSHEPLARNGVDFHFSYSEDGRDGHFTFGVAISALRAANARKKYPFTKQILFRPEWNYKQVKQHLKLELSLQVAA